MSRFAPWILAGSVCASLLSGCASAPYVAPVSGTPQVAAHIGGVQLAVPRVSPEDFPESELLETHLAIYVQLRNQSAEEVAVEPQHFTLARADGYRMRALNAIELSQCPMGAPQPDYAMVPPGALAFQPRFGGPVANTVPFGSVPVCVGGPRYHSVDLRSVLRLQLKAGRLSPGQVVGGFLYFPRPDAMPAQLWWSPPGSAPAQVTLDYAEP